MAASEAKLKPMRYERKYRLPFATIEEVESFVQTHPSGFRPAHPDRQINNIYMDTPFLQCYHENLSGVSQRKKYRIRWYGHIGASVENAKFEIKYKENLLGGKKKMSFPPFDWTTFPRLLNTFLEENSLETTLVPSLINAYRRKYYIDWSGRFRLTIDYDLSFAAFVAGSMPVYFRPSNDFIVEIKYKQIFDPQFEEISEYWPFRINKNSKYVEGIQLVNS